MVLLAEHTPPPGASAEGVGQGRHQRVLAESIKSGEIIYFYCRSPAVGDDSQNGTHCYQRAAVIYELNHTYSNEQYHSFALFLINHKMVVFCCGYACYKMDDRKKCTSFMGHFVGLIITGALDAISFG